MLSEEHTTPDQSSERHLCLESDSDFAARSIPSSTPYDEAMCTPRADDLASDAPSEPDDEFMEYVKVLHERLATNNSAQLRTVCLHCVFVIVALCWPASPLFSRNTALQKVSTAILGNKLSVRLPVSWKLLFGAPSNGPVPLAATAIQLTHANHHSTARHSAHVGDMHIKNVLSPVPASVS